VLRFAVGFKVQGATGHVSVDAEDALIAALKVKMQRPEALIAYVRRQNKRGDARRPMHGRATKALRLLSMRLFAPGSSTAPPHFSRAAPKREMSMRNIGWHPSFALDEGYRRTISWPLSG
jgi:hypothetical protein